MGNMVESRLLPRLHAYLAACRRLRTEREAGGLLSLLARIEDPDLRLHRFAEHLLPRPVDEAAWTLAYVQERVASGNHVAQAIGLGLLDKGRLGRALPAGVLEAAAAILARRGHPSAGLFQDHLKRADATDESVLPRPKEPVGYRISLARQSVAGSLERLLFDPDARVVRTILGNPRLTEAEVVKLASTRRAGAEALEAIAQDERWIARYPVKIALANNPATPTRVVLGLLPYLMRQDLRILATEASRRLVQERAASLLSLRGDA
jgi:hypothetical protein